MFGLEKLGTLGQGANDAPAILSKEEIERRRKLAQSLMQQGSDTSPVQHWTQGAARIAQALDGAITDYQATGADRAAQADWDKRKADIFGGQTASLPSSGGTMTSGVAGAPGNIPAVSRGGGGYDNPMSRALYDTAIKRGLSPVQASAFVGAGALPESTLNPDARNPGDGRDGSDSIGMMQWNGSRAQALKAYAASKGLPWNDRSVQAEFALDELQGAEGKAGGMLRAAKTPEEATAAMLAYLRPGGYTPQNPAGVPSYGARLQNTSSILSSFSAPAAGALSPTAGTTVDAAPGQPAPPVQVAQAMIGQGPSPAAGGQSLAKLLALSGAKSFDRASPGERKLVEALIAKQVATESKDPLDQEQKRLNIEKIRGELANSGLSKREQELRIRKAENDLERKPNIEIIRDAATGEVIAVDKNDIDSGIKKLREGGPSKDAPTTRNIKQPDGSEVAVQWNPQARAWEPLKAPEGGNAVRAPGKLTEQQSKDLVYYERGSQALATLDAVGGDVLASGSESAKNAIPGVGNYLTSEKFQQAKQAGESFLASILRKDTGAAITQPEQEIYGRIFLPRPGDGPAVLTQKTEARRQAMDAIRSGLGPAEVLAIGSRLTKRGDAKTPMPDGERPNSRPGKRDPAADPLGLFQ